MRIELKIEAGNISELKEGLTELLTQDLGGDKPEHPVGKMSEHTTQPAIPNPDPTTPINAATSIMPSHSEHLPNMPPTADVNGYPWDARIHSSAKSFTSKGIWKYKRGVTPDIIEKVEAELKSTSVSTIPMYTPSQPSPLPPAPVTDDTNTILHKVLTGTAGVNELLAVGTELISGGTVTFEWLNQKAQEVGLTAFSEIRLPANINKIRSLASLILQGLS